MTKRAGFLFVLCCFLVAALPAMAPAEVSLSRQSLAEDAIAGLQNKLLADDADDGMSLNGLTVQFLDALLRAGRNKDADRYLAVMQYSADMQDQFAAAALNLACSQDLLMSLTANGSIMIEELASGTTGACQAISLSKGAASIMAAKYTYDICDENMQPNPDTTKIQDLEQKQFDVKVYSFIADVLNVVICTSAPSSQDFVSLIVTFIALFA